MECKRYLSRLAELVATKKGESYMTTMSWIRAEVSFAKTSFTLFTRIGSTSRVYLELSDMDLDIEN